MTKAEKQNNWYFTFGNGQPYYGYFIKLYGTFNEARQKMVNAFGLKWSMQYSEKEWLNPKKETTIYNGLNPKDKPTMADVWNWKEIK